MGGVGCCGCCTFDVWLLGSMILVSYCTTFPFLSKKTVMYLESPNRLLYLAYSHLSPNMSKLVSLGSPRMAITSCLVIPRSTFLFPLADADIHTANINIVVAISAISSFLFIIVTVFEGS